MARVELNLPEQFFFATDIEVRYTDINTAGHVGNDQMISLLSAARYSFFQHLNIDPSNIDDVMVVAADLAATYRSESFVGDRLRFELGFMDFNKYGVDMIFRVTKEGGKLVVLAKTGFVFVSKKTRKVTPMPEVFINSIPAQYRP